MNGELNGEIRSATRLTYTFIEYASTEAMEATLDDWVQAATTLDAGIGQLRSRIAARRKAAGESP